MNMLARLLHNVMPSAEETQTRISKGVMPEDEKEFCKEFLEKPDDKAKAPTQFQKRMQSGGA